MTKKINGLDRTESERQLKEMEIALGGFSDEEVHNEPKVISRGNFVSAEAEYDRLKRLGLLSE